MGSRFQPTSYRICHQKGKEDAVPNNHNETNECPHSSWKFGPINVAAVQDVDKCNPQLTKTMMDWKKDLYILNLSSKIAGLVKNVNGKPRNDKKVVKFVHKYNFELQIKA